MTRRPANLESGEEEEAVEEERGQQTATARTEFLVSFLVDARGGTRTACRKSGIRIVIPARAAEQPVRVTCRQVRPEAVLHPPPLSEGEGLAACILQLTPAQFLSPVLLEVPHFTPVNTEREVVVYRCDSGKKWSLHTNCLPGPGLADFCSGTNRMKERRVEVVSKSLPQYLALVSRPRLQTIALGPEGGRVSSSLAPGVQCHFPPRALTKPVSVGLSVCRPRQCLLTDLTVQGGVVSPVITIEPRRRKFHKPITVTIPVPQLRQAEHTTAFNSSHSPLRENNMAIEMSLLLLCSMSEAGSRAAWEDVTHSTPFTFNQGCLQFTSVVSAAFWLVNLPTWMAADAVPVLDKLFRSMSRVPYIVRVYVYWRPAEPGQPDGSEAEVRLLISTERERAHETSLEFREGFKSLWSSEELELLERAELELKLRGNLVKASEFGRMHFNPFTENRITLGVRRGQGSIAAAGHLDLSTEEAAVFSTSVLLPIKKKPISTSQTA